MDQSTSRSVSFCFNLGPVDLKRLDPLGESADLAALMPLAATAGRPIPGSVESPHCSRPFRGVTQPGNSASPALHPGPYEPANANGWAHRLFEEGSSFFLLKKRKEKSKNLGSEIPDVSSSLGEGGTISRVCAHDIKQP